MIVFWCILFSAIFGSFVRPCVERCCPKIKFGDIEVVQEIDNYYKAIDETQRQWHIEEERYARKELHNLTILDDKTYNKLIMTESAKTNNIQGVHTYDILANPKYCDAFQYVAAGTENRAAYIIDNDLDESNDAAQSDIVRIALNLAYYLKEDAEKFDFDPKTFKKKMSKFS